MFEFLFLLTFALVLVFTGVSIIGMMIAVAAGFAIMAVVGMLGLVIKLLPWILLIAVVIWLVRDNKEVQNYKERLSRSRRY
ncbi:envelope stress response protein PspG [Photobacterium leiognathi]|uniref:Envelope stress response protein PspG n=2 Tax=Photobacterium leiognathi TaxID=553611 RepID=A0A0D8MSK7_PHOLE|nr:envelope stress response protein PspG [Photobacterium leiognathi]KJF89383.1 phage-shock protein [Photobacterium leiognathi]KJF97135.1 phage-shock protein [Photobacterium leiognathi]PHZ59693.1 envelope stress response protein PspG [Photobacterium leiognathi]PSU98850.1 envelope stress response protein PspG [Photobacterium leiognathi subsp. mandapamensis]PSV07651.1 envelope stress response protein PspG [Photobacterium leiognathi subsp. mandapamensis]